MKVNIDDNASIDARRAYGVLCEALIGITVAATIDEQRWVVEAWVLGPPFEDEVRVDFWLHPPTDIIANPVIIGADAAGHSIELCECLAADCSLRTAVLLQVQYNAEAYAERLSEDTILH